MQTAGIDPQLRTEFEAVVADSGCELLDVEFHGGVLRLVLDRPDGVTLGHCQGVAREASALLDVQDFGPGRYTLEVSSPGLDRKLYRLSDYLRFVGQRVKITWQTAEMENKRTITGRLDQYRSTDREIEVVEDNDLRHTIAIHEILVARLDPEL